MKTNRCTIEKIKMADYDEIQPLFLMKKLENILEAQFKKKGMMIHLRICLILRMIHFTGQ